MINWIKKNPVRAFTLLVLALGTFDGAAKAAGLLDGRPLAWIGVIEAVLTGVIGGTSVHNAVTPLADPKTSTGEPLVPAITADPSVTS